jgi:hypothetical protein
LPGGTDSINIPKILSGTAVGIQTVDNEPVTDVDLIDTFINAPVISGQQGVAIQLLDQSPTAFDEIIFRDLTDAVAGERVQGRHRRGVQGHRPCRRSRYQECPPVRRRVVPTKTWLADQLSAMGLTPSEALNQPPSALASTDRPRRQLSRKMWPSPPDHANHRNLVYHG